MRILFLIALLVLIPVWLHDLYFKEAQTKPLPAPRLESSSPMKPLPQGRLGLQTAPAIDREAFLASFSRQAGASLLGCLKEWRGPSGRVTFLARLNRQGEMKAVRLIDPKQAAPDCVTSAIREMRFEPIAERLSIESVELEWRLDW